MLISFYQVSLSHIDMLCVYFNYRKAPLNDPKACASLMGLKPSTTKSHLVRAILESVAFRWAILKTFKLLHHSFLFMLTDIVSFYPSSYLQKQSALWDNAERNTHSHHEDQVQFISSTKWISVWVQSGKFAARVRKTKHTADI